MSRWATARLATFGGPATEAIYLHLRRGAFPIPTTADGRLELTRNSLAALIVARVFLESLVGAGAARVHGSRLRAVYMASLAVFREAEATGREPWSFIARQDGTFRAAVGFTASAAAQAAGLLGPDVDAAPLRGVLETARLLISQLQDPDCRETFTSLAASAAKALQN